MRVVIGLLSLGQPGGTESYVLTVARELGRLGHEVVVAAQELGPMAEEAERAGVRVAADATEWPDRCDAIFAHDAIMTCELAERYSDTRLVYFAHSPVYEHQLPILLEGVVAAVVVASELTARRIRALALDAPIVRLRHPIDTDRFSAGPIRDRPRRALLLGNYLTGRRRKALVDAWEEAGVECVQVGAYSRTTADVVPEIAHADIVVAKARAALEGMSCARAVYVYDAWGGDGWVTPGNYSALEANNFAGLATGLPRGSDELADDLAAYSADMGWLNRELAVTHHSARRHAESLVRVLSGGAPRQNGVAPYAELARLARIGLHAQREAAGQREQAIAWREQALVAEQELTRLRDLLATRRARTGMAVGRMLDRVRART